MDEKRDFSVGDESDELAPREPGDAADASEAAVDAFEELEKARAEAADWRDKYLRKVAEFDNFRRRTRQETALLGQSIAETLVTSLLPIMDDFDRMLAQVGDADDPYRKGAELMRGKLRAFFEQQGVQKMDSVGKPFDPEEHDALLMRPTPGFPAGTVLEVVNPGYRMGDRVIRHAQVIVSADAEDATPAV